MIARTYSTVQSAKRALRKQGLQTMPVEFEIETTPLGRERFVPVVQCHSESDFREIRSAGFKAMLLRSKVA